MTSQYFSSPAVLAVGFFADSKENGLLLPTPFFGRPPPRWSVFCTFLKDVFLLHLSCGYSANGGFWRQSIPMLAIRLMPEIAPLASGEAAARHTALQFFRLYDLPYLYELHMRIYMDCRSILLCSPLHLLLNLAAVAVFCRSFISAQP